MTAQNYEDFEQGQDFYEGRNVNLEKVYTNLNYEQFRWDNRSINYYIDDSGNLLLELMKGILTQQEYNKYVKG